MRGPINRLRDFLGAIGDRLVVDGGDLARRAGATLRRPFEGIAWRLQDRVLWPLQDRLPHPEGASRVLAFGGVVAVAAGVGVAGLLLVASSGSGGSAAREASGSSAPIAKVVPSTDKIPGPTLHGAPPVFKSAAKGGKPAADPAGQVESSPSEEAAATASSSSAATGKIASAPTAQASTVASPPAGPAAIAVAHKFASAFVSYETGGVEAPVRDAFGETATKELSRALLRRPPRLPADVKVPKAKVLNVVAAPSRGSIYPVSVSLVRLGVTSELRLSMEWNKNDEWRVSDVLG
jgi:hypothetical protein